MQAITCKLYPPMHTHSLSYVIAIIELPKGPTGAAFLSSLTVSYNSIVAINHCVYFLDLLTIQQVLHVAVDGYSKVNGMIMGVLDCCCHHTEEEKEDTSYTDLQSSCSSSGCISCGYPFAAAQGLMAAASVRGLIGTFSCDWSSFSATKKALCE